MLSDEIKRELDAVDNSFPIDVFPKAIQDLILDAERTVQFPKEYFAAGILSASASGIGNSVVLDNGSYIVKPILWISIIGRSGDTKTHPLAFAIKPLEERDNLAYDEYKQASAEYDSQLQEERKNKPKFKKFILKDFTPESLAVALELNEKGILIFRDELMGWINSFDAYKKGGDQECYLELWNGGILDVTRKGSEPIRAKNTICNILGSMQPEKLTNMAKNNRDSDGFLARFLFVYPENPKPRKFNSLKISDRNRNNYFNMLNNLLATTETVLSVNDEAIEIYKKWQHRTVVEYWNDHLEKAIQAKMETYVWRLALVLEMMEQASCGRYSSYLSADSLEKAIRLTEYFRYNMLKVYERIFNKTPLDDLTTLQRIIYEKLPDCFIRKDVLSMVNQEGMPIGKFDRFLAKRSIFHNQYTAKGLGYGEYKKVDFNGRKS